MKKADEIKDPQKQDSSSKDENVRASGLKKRSKVLLFAITAVSLIAAIVVIACLGKSSESKVLDYYGEKLPIQTAKWERVSVDGHEAIQATFTNSTDGTLEVTYSPSMGFRFGYYDANGTPVSFESAGDMTGVLPGVRTTQEMIDEEKKLMTEEEFEEMQIEDELGEIKFLLLTLGGLKRNQYLLYSSDYQEFLKLLNNGKIEALDLIYQQANTNITDPSDPDYPEVKQIMWATEFVPNDFAKASAGL